MPDLDSSPRLNDDVRYRLLDDEGVAVRQSTGEILVVNQVGAKIVERLDGKTSLESIVDELLQQYDVDRATLEQDTLQLLTELSDAGLIADESAP